MITINYAFIIVILNFILLLVILNKLLYKPIKKFLEERQAKIEADLDTYKIKFNAYNLIVNCNFLERRHFPQIKEALKEGGLLIYETFIVTHGEGYHQPSNLDFVLRKNELLHAFIGLNIIYYEERDEVNLQGEKVKVASLVARKA